MNTDNLSFEEALKRLEQIVQTMEKGDAKLEDSLQLFQEGTELLTRCGKLLDEAEMKITTITSGADGSPREEAFSYEP